MTQKERPSNKISDEDVRAYLERNRRLQRWAWLSSALPLVVILTFVVVGTLRLKRLQHDTNAAQVLLATTREEITKLEDKRATLDKRLAIVTKQINAYDSSVPNDAGTTHQSTHSVSGHHVTISINIAQSRPYAEAKKVEEVFRAHGYEVSAIYVTRPGEWTRETTVRFFQYDRSTVAIGRELVALMKGIGFSVRTEFDDEFVGNPLDRLRALMRSTSVMILAIIRPTILSAHLQVLLAESAHRL